MQAEIAKDEVMPDGAWEFDKDVTDVFDDMLARSIPQYEAMRQLCFDLACKYQKRDTHIVDLGCSRGEAMAKLVYEYGINNQFVGVEISEPMRMAAEKRFAGLIPTCVNIRDIDLRYDYPQVAASVTLCVLTLQFTPIEYRLKILQNIYKHTRPGGVLIIVEKVLGSSASIDNNMVDIYYDLKRANGYTEDQIQRKRLSLEGVLVPLTARWNEEMLQMVGFAEVDCFWRWMNFVGWLAIKS
jgi:tRNA (cmo5U34)-methyltransferase